MGSVQCHAYGQETEMDSPRGHAMQELRPRYRPSHTPSIKRMRQLTVYELYMLSHIEPTVLSEV